MKKCCRCKFIKDESQFYACPGVYDSLRPECRECTKLKRKYHYYRYQEEEIQTSSAYNKKHPVQTKAIKARYDKSPKCRYSIYKSNAKIGGRAFKLTFEQFMQFWQKPCHYCSSSIETIGLDRIDNNKGYSLDNVTPCCETCNKMKCKLMVSEFVEHCEKVVKNLITNKEK